MILFFKVVYLLSAINIIFSLFLIKYHWWYYTQLGFISSCYCCNLDIHYESKWLYYYYYLYYYYRLKHDDVFKFIRQHNLFSSISSSIVQLMDFNTELALDLLLNNMESISVSLLLFFLIVFSDYLFLVFFCLKTNVHGVC